MSSIKPEYLMEPGDYKMWVQLQKDIQAKKNKTGHRDIRTKTEDEETIEEQLFEAVSKRAWTDVMLQLLKVTHAFNFLRKKQTMLDLFKYQDRYMLSSICATSFILTFSKMLLVYQPI